MAGSGVGRSWAASSTSTRRSPETAGHAPRPRSGTPHAYAYAATGNRDDAISHARKARTIARQINSDRQLRRLDRLILPHGQAA